MQQGYTHVNPDKRTWQNHISWLWRLSYGFRGKIVMSSLIGILHIGATLLFIWTCKQLIDMVTNSSSTSIGWYVGLLVCCVAIQLSLSVINSRMEAYMNVTIQNSIRYRLFSRIMESRWTGRDAFHTGDVINRLEEDVNRTADTLCRVIPSSLVTGVQLLASLFFLAQLNIRLAGVLVCIMPIALLTSKSYVRRLRRLTHDIRTTDSQVQTHMQEHLQHRTLISTLEKTQYATDALADLQRGLKQQVLHRSDFSLYSRTVVQVGFAAGYITAFLWGVHGLQNGAVTFGMMTAFLQLVAQIQRPMVDLSRQIPSFVHTLTSVERLQELAQLPLEEQGQPISLSNSVGVKFDQVDFSYPDGDRRVISSFSYDFKPESLTAVIGPTGVGKSTLIRLMLGLLKPNKGTICFYNDQISVRASARTRCNLIYVPQGNTLISGTIRQNLLLGNIHATDDQLAAALHAAVADFVYDLPAGLDTPCGEMGAGLSEGQAQRIAIARGLLRSGGVVLLDEPSSSLDPHTEEILFYRLREEVQHKTLILVTHRERIANLCTQTISIKKAEVH